MTNDVVFRKSAERGFRDHGWLQTHHTFSFADYLDPAWRRFGPLRVINEDVVQASSGFGEHAHRDMEIITYVIDGALQHRDSMDNGSVIRAGMVQRMSAGTGVLHSEFNAAPDVPVHLLQIWIFPAENNLEPSYEEGEFSRMSKLNQMKLIVSPDGDEDSLRMNQNARMFASILESGRSLKQRLAPKRRAWVQMVSGTLRVNDHVLSAGDGLGLSDVERVNFDATADAEFLFFDLP